MAKIPEKVGSYSALTKTGGGYLWDDVLEYRVWIHPNGDDYFVPFATYQGAKNFSEQEEKAEKPLALVLQKKGHWVAWDEKGVRIGDTNRITEWKVDWLKDKNFSDANLKRALKQAKREQKAGE